MTMMRSGPFIKLAVTTACVFSDAHQIHMLTESCRRFGVALRPYGTDVQGYPGWLAIKVRELLRALPKFKSEGFTHVLYTDGRDSYFIGAVDEIITKYKAHGSPRCLMSAESEPAPFPELGVAYDDPGHRFRYLNAGGYIAEIAWLERYYPLLLTPEYMQYGDNDQAGLTIAFLESKFSGLKLDTDCDIFQCVGNANAGLGTDLVVQKGPPSLDRLRLRNKTTSSWPVIVHFNGGYTDPETGKDAMMLPLWNELGL